MDLLAPAEVKRLAIIGSGFQAETQLRAIRAVRNPASIAIWSRSERRREFADRYSAVACRTPEEALAGADLVVTATSSKDPVIDSAWISPSAIVCAMGSNYSDRRELPGDLVSASRIVVDDIEQCRIEAGDLLLAPLDWSRVESLASLAVNEKAGFGGRLTIFKSVGLGIEDVAVAAHLYENYS
ncbi:MAG TPA: NAD(P)-binding domain-containing protein [Bryobacteraceae bacterium]|nr:NAD(P)-binding domain-containing protein [Bryobacteraceae bacterium]